MSQMNWHEWLQAEGYLDKMSPAAKQAFAKSLESQKSFREVEQTIRDAGLQKMSPCPVGLMVMAVTRSGEQSLADTQVVFQVLLEQIRQLSSRIAALENRS